MTLISSFCSCRLIPTTFSFSPIIWVRCAGRHWLWWWNVSWKGLPESRLIAQRPTIKAYPENRNHQSIQEKGKIVQVRSVCVGMKCHSRIMCGPFSNRQQLHANVHIWAQTWCNIHPHSSAKEQPAYPHGSCCWIHSYWKFISVTCVVIPKKIIGYDWL